MGYGGVERDPRTVGEADEDGAGDIERVEQGAQVVVVGVVPGHGGGQAVAAEVVTDRAQAGVHQPGELLVPHVLVEHAAVEQHHRGARAGRLVEQLTVVDRHDAVVDLGPGGDSSGHLAGRPLCTGCGEAGVMTLSSLLPLLP